MRAVDKILLHFENLDVHIVGKRNFGVQRLSLAIFIMFEKFIGISAISKILTVDFLHLNIFFSAINCLYVTYSHPLIRTSNYFFVANLVSLADKLKTAVEEPVLHLLQPSSCRSLEAFSSNN